MNNLTIVYLTSDDLKEFVISTKLSIFILCTGKNLTNCSVFIVVHGPALKMLQILDGCGSIVVYHLFNIVVEGVRPHSFGPQFYTYFVSYLSAIYVRRRKTLVLDTIYQYNIISGNNH